MAEPTNDSRLQLLIGPIVAVLVLLLSLTEGFERAELLSYDYRFKLRNLVFGQPDIDPRLGSIEINDQAIAEEGRFQNWTRAEYLDVVRILGEYGADRVAFDIYFMEAITKLLTEKQIRSLSSIDEQGIEGLLRDTDYDSRFAQVIEKADNVYLAQYVYKDSKQGDQLSSDQLIALEYIKDHSPRLMVPVEESTIIKAVDFTPPIAILRNPSRGFSYAQTEKDSDGSRRRYPVVYQYEGILFPSIALQVGCAQLQVDMTDVQVWPGKHVLIPNANMPDGRVKDIKIPINNDGTMYVNWTGTWKETFVRYPHWALSQAAQTHDSQKLFDNIKSLIAQDPSIRSNPRLLLKSLVSLGYTKKAIKNQWNFWNMSSQIERSVLRQPDLDANKFYSSVGMKNPSDNNIKLFNDIKRNNRIAQIVEQTPDIDFAGLENLLPEYYAGGDHYMKRVKRAFDFVRRHMIDGKVDPAIRPLYLYPAKLTEVREEEGHKIERLITPEEIKGKILFYGETTTGSTDLSVTPFEGNYPMVGIYSNVLNTIFNESFIRRPWIEVRYVFILVLGVAMSIFVPRYKVLQGALIVGALGIVYALLTFYSFTQGIWLDFVGPVLTIVAGYLVITIYGYIKKEKEKEFVQGAFGHYLSPAVVEQIMDNPDMVNQLGGEERVMTAFFSDIASFSTISECLTPAELVDFINGYLTEMCDIIEQYGGTIDKFEGDAIVAFFGAPLYYEDHASRAVMACIDQQKKLLELRERWNQPGAIPPRLEELRDRWQSQGSTFAQVRIGVTAGPMIVGNMGSRSRTDYTMMGDTVNLAARFESGQKIYGTNIMVNDQIYEQVKDLVEARQLDLIQVMGKEEPVVAYEILERKGELSEEMMQVVELYNKGMKAYWDYDFATASTFFESALEIVPDDGPSALYADRCEEFTLNPPEDLVFRADSK